MISGLLTGKKAVLDRPSASAEVTFPDVSRSLGEILLRSKDRSDPRSRFDASSIALDPPPIKLPDGGLPDGSNHVDHPREARRGVVSLSGEHSSPMIEANVGSTPVGRDVAPAPPSKTVGSSGGVSESSKPGKVVDPRIVAQTVRPIAGGRTFPPGKDGDPDSHHDTGLTVGLASRSETQGIVGVGQNPDQKEVLFSSKAFAVGLPRESGGVKATSGSRILTDLQGVGASVSRSEITVNHESRSASHTEPSTTLVRYPLSSDLRNFSLASTPHQGGTGPFPDQVGKGREFDDDSFGRTTSPQGGTSIDLSKTNELLQQLIDAVRKQRGSALPIGGPSVYPDR